MTNRDKKCYVECCCSSFDHILRVWHQRDEIDSQYFLQYKLMRFPSSRPLQEYYFLPTDGFKNKLKNLIVSIKMRLDIIEEYFKMIIWAILGKSILFNGETILTTDEIKKLNNFLSEEILDDKANQ